MNERAWWIAAPIATTLLYAGARWVHARRRAVWTLPILLTALSVGVLLLALRLDLAAYGRGARPLSWLLGPSTVALAVPLHRHQALLRKQARALLLAVPSGALMGVISAVLLARTLGLSAVIVRSLAPKSVTTPIAMPIAERLGGAPSLTACVVVLTGVLGLSFGAPLLDAARIRAPLARGLALGTSTHAVGTVKALEEGPETGAASAVAMVLAGIVTALLAAPLLRWLA